MRENRDRLSAVGIDHLDQTFGSYGAKVTLVAVCVERIDCDKPDRIVLDGVVDKIGIGIEIAAGCEGRAQIRPIVLIAGQYVNRRTRVSENCRRLRIFVRPSVMNNISGMNDQVGGRIERVDVGNSALEIAYSPIGVGRIESDMGMESA